VTRRPECRLRDHRWRLVRGGKREQCDVCGTSFPCRHSCGHLDCAAVKTGEWPNWIEEVRA